jgi:integrase
VEIKTMSFTDKKLLALEVGEKLKDHTEGLSAVRLKGYRKIAFVWHKRIRGSKQYPTLTIGYYGGESLNDIRMKAMQYNRHADHGVNPRDYYNERRKIKERTTKTLREVLENYNRLKSDRNSPTTIKERNNQMENMWGDYLDKPIGELDAGIIDARFNEFKSQRGAPSSARLGVRHLNALLNRAKRLKYIRVNPLDEIAEDIQPFAKEKSRNIFLSFEENVALISGIKELCGERGLEILKECPDYKKSWHSNYSLLGYRAILLMLYSGLRKNEVCTLKWDQVYLEGLKSINKKIPFFTVTLSKQKQKFAIPITQSMMRVFRDIKAMKIKSEYVFPLSKNYPMGSLRRVCRNIQDYIFPEGFTEGETVKFMPQVLRHNFATHSFGAGLSPSQVSAITGHASSDPDKKLGATEVYMHSNAETNLPLFERVEEALMGKAYGLSDELYADEVVQPDAPISDTPSADDTFKNEE